MPEGLFERVVVHTLESLVCTTVHCNQAVRKQPSPKAPGLRSRTTSLVMANNRIGEASLKPPLIIHNTYKWSILLFPLLINCFVSYFYSQQEEKIHIIQHSILLLLVRIGKFEFTDVGRLRKEFEKALDDVCAWGSLGQQPERFAKISTFEFLVF